MSFPPNLNVTYYVTLPRPARTVCHLIGDDGVFA
jgi:hypothetical protein